MTINSFLIIIFLQRTVILVYHKPHKKVKFCSLKKSNYHKTKDKNLSHFLTGSDKIQRKLCTAYNYVHALESKTCNVGFIKLNQIRFSSQVILTGNILRVGKYQLRIEI